MRGLTDETWTLLRWRAASQGRWPPGASRGTRSPGSNGTPAKLNERGELVGHGDAIPQVRQCLRNLAVCLAAAGATPGDVVRTTVYVAAEERAVLEQAPSNSSAGPGGSALGKPGQMADAGGAGKEGSTLAPRRLVRSARC